ncbi:unnamed protein product [Rotaria sp. Silwood1]|nr:unnamed protein product [Rotaria sp. Silwood1]CAF3600230.1 unnamed protein product [Rotaria sp. Silwood1]
MKMVHQMLSQWNDRPMNNDFSQVTTVRICNTDRTQLQDLYEMLNSLSSGIDTLSNDQEHLSNESLQIQVTIAVLTEELSKAKLSIEETNALLEGVKLNQDILNQNLASIHEKVKELQYLSYDGTFV